MKAMEEGFIKVPGGRIWYGIAGASASSLPLLVVHGGPGGPHDYLESLEVLSAERPVIFYDQLGCGNSERPEDLSLFTLPRFVEELSLLREALGLTRLHILGQSWGSMLVAEYVLTQKPEGVASLVFSGPCLSAQRFITDQRQYLSAFPDSLRRIINQSEATGEFASQAYQDAMNVYYRTHVCRLDPWPESMERTFSKFGHFVYEYMWGPSEFTLTGTLKEYDRTAELKEITVPVLFTAGRYDEAAPATVEYYRDMLPGSEMIIFEEASHMHHLEQPEAYMKAVGEFLLRHDT